jgi:streptogramin lyase
VSALYGLVTATAPFQPMLASAPNDWNLQLIYRPVTGSTGTTQTAIAIDALGNAWIANEFTTSSNSASSVSELSNNGSILSGAAGYTGGGLNRPTGIAIDPSGNAWIMNSTNPSLTKLSSTGSPLSGTTGFASPLSRGLAIDGSGNVWCGSRLAKFDNNGNNLSGSGYTGGGVGGTNSVGGIAIDAAGSAWLAVVTGFDTSTVAKFSSFGVALSPASGYTTDGLSEAWSVAIDNAGNAWVTNNGPPTLASVFKLAHDGTMLSGSGGFTGGGIENPLGVAIDGAGNVWVTSDKVVTVNGTTTSLNSLVELDNSGTILSGATGYALPAGFSVGVAVDASGNVWAAMASNYVIEMVGVATPVVTPLSVGVKNNTLGARP